MTAGENSLCGSGTLQLQYGIFLWFQNQKMGGPGVPPYLEKNSSVKSYARRRNKANRPTPRPIKTPGSGTGEMVILARDE